MCETREKETSGKRSLHELDLADDFLFAKVMEDREVCRRILEKILGVCIERVETVSLQKTIDLDISAKGIRLDVYLADSQHTVYTVEMQKGNEHNIPKRSRYYQGAMDLDMLGKGVPYSELKRNVIIFICTFDFFRRGKHQYAFENRCVEDQELRFGDDTLKIILNTKGTDDDVDQEMADFLYYVDHSSDEVAAQAHGGLVQLIHQQVKKVKDNKELEVEYMKLMERDQENREEGRREERKEVAKKLKEAGIDINVIMECTGLSLEEVEKL